jgi:hypothetical protein
MRANTLNRLRRDADRYTALADEEKKEPAVRSALRMAAFDLKTAVEEIDRLRDKLGINR